LLLPLVVGCGGQDKQTPNDSLQTPCVSHTECTEGEDYCKPTDPAGKADGYCEPLEEEGGVCSWGIHCDTGLFCLVDSASNEIEGVCRATPEACDLGASCGCVGVLAHCGEGDRTCFSEGPDETTLICHDGLLYDPGEYAPRGCVDEDYNLSLGFQLSGTVTSWGNGNAPSYPLDICVSAGDPSPVLSGAAITWGTPTTLCENGDFILAELTDVPSQGLLLKVEACEEATAEFMPTAGVVSYTALASLNEGDRLTGIDLKALRQSLANDIAVELGRDDFSLEYALIGTALDSGGNPVDGAWVSCGGCAEFSYFDSDPSDGLFQTDGSANSSTSALANGAFISASAPFYTYTLADGGVNEWSSQLIGGAPGVVVFLPWKAE
jgi:hypothetical protein